MKTSVEEKEEDKDKDKEKRGQGEREIWGKVTLSVFLDDEERGVKKKVPKWDWWTRDLSSSDRKEVMKTSFVGKNKEKRGHGDLGKEGNKGRRPNIAPYKVKCK